MQNTFVIVSLLCIVFTSTTKLTKEIDMQKLTKDQELRADSMKDFYPAL